MEWLVWILVSILCYKIAEDKNRNAICWAIGGFLFSLIALVILLILPKLEGENNE